MTESMPHTLGVETSFDPDAVFVWGFCPHSEDERLGGADCSVAVRVDLPPEPLPRPYRKSGVWCVPCLVCGGEGRTRSAAGVWTMPKRCSSCAGSGDGVQVSSTHPWFRWSELPKVEPSGVCVVEAYP